MSTIEALIENVSAHSQVLMLIERCQNDTSKCTTNESEIHNQCISPDTDKTPVLLCPKALIFAMMRLLAFHPKLIDEEVQVQFVNYFKTKDIKASGLISGEILSTLSRTESQTLTWLKYENLLIALIKQEVYEPKSMANEIMSTFKEDMDHKVAAKFSSVIGSCVKYCREVNNSDANMAEEVEEKWCEIIDWMSWFIVEKDEISDLT